MSEWKQAEILFPRLMPPDEASAIPTRAPSATAIEFPVKKRANPRVGSHTHSIWALVRPRRVAYFAFDCIVPSLVAAPLAGGLLLGVLFGPDKHRKTIASIICACALGAILLFVILRLKSESYASFFAVIGGLAFVVAIFALFAIVGLVAEASNVNEETVSKGNGTTMKYYCKQWGTELGPLSRDKLREMALAGHLLQDHFIRAENTDKWVTADSLPNLFVVSGGAPMPQNERTTKIRNAPSTEASRPNRLAWFFGASTLVLTLVVIGLVVPMGVTIVEQPVASSIPPDSIPKPEKRLDEFVQQNKNLLPTEWPQPRISTPQEKVDVPLPPRVFKTGEIAIAGGIGYKVADSLWSNSISSNALMNTPPRSAYLMVFIAIINGNKEPYLLPPLKLLDENGTEYARSHNDLMEKNSLQPVENLNPEVGVVGSIVFDVPKNHQYRLVVSGGMLSPERAYISLQPKEVSGQPRR